MYGFCLRAHIKSIRALQQGSSGNFHWEKHICNSLRLCNFLQFLFLLWGGPWRENSGKRSKCSPQWEVPQPAEYLIGFPAVLQHLGSDNRALMPLLSVSFLLQPVMLSAVCVCWTPRESSRGAEAGRQRPV